MENLYKDACFTKSFYMIGNSLKNCYNCSYCRLIGEKTKDINYNIIPSTINPLFINLPVAVNLFYGDPLLQVNNTINYLRLLEEHKHKGPVIIITKGDFNNFPKINFDLDLHFAFSTFGVNSKYDGGNIKTFENNLDLASKSNYKYSIEYRPVIKDINDSYNTIENIYMLADKYKASIGFCGLQVNKDLYRHFMEHKLKFKPFEPYDGYKFGMKKAVSKEVEDIFYGLSEYYDVPTFRKTSCLISYTHSLERDYNAHYYRPNEMRCSKCVMKDKCLEYKNNQDKSIIDKVNIPFDHEIVNKDKHECILHKKGICKFANNDCKNINGKMIKINQKITSSDLRVIKWLTGMTVECDFEELEFISNNWINK